MQSPQVETQYKQAVHDVNGDAGDRPVSSLKVSFAPQFFKINPYQQQLIDGLESLGVQVRGIDSEITFLPGAVRQWHPEIVHLHWLHRFYHERDAVRSLLKSIKFIIGLLVLKLMGKKIVWTVHNLESHEASYPLSDRVCNYCVAQLADAIITHSKAAREKVEEKFNVKSLDKVFVVPHGNYITCYKNQISRQEARKILGIPESSVVFLFLGLVRPYKGVSELLQAVKELNSDEVYLIIAGKSRDNELVYKIHRGIGDSENIKFVPKFIPDDEIQVYMNACDAVPLPYRDFLTSGAVLLAISFGRACIAPRKGFIGEVLDNEGSFLYAPEAEDGLFQALKSALSQKDNLARMGEHNYHLAEQLSWDQTARMTLDIYQKCLNRKS